MELSGLRWLDTLGGLLLLLALWPGLVHSNCVFGPNNTDHLILRNNTILSLMNATLINFTQSGHQAVARVSNFDLVSYLSYNCSLTAEKYLEFVSLGKMLTIDWAAATKNAMTNETSTSRTVASFITTVFVTPLHDELQEMASYYSFSYRIFRPAPKQFNFTGLTPATSSGENSTLDLSCTAGSSFLLRLSSSITYNALFSDKRSPQFAKIATAIEQAFDQYYRQTTAPSKGYIRSNVINGFEGSTFLIIFMEVYFLNPTLQSADIFNLTILSRLPTIYYNDPLSAASTTVVTFRSNFTYVVNASYAPSTTTQSTMSTRTWTTNSPTTITPSFGLNSNPTTLGISSTIPTTNPAFSQFPSQSPAIQSNWTSTNVNITNLTQTPVANSSQEVTTLTSNLTSYSTSSASLAVQTTLLSQITSTTATTSSSISSPTSSESISNPISASSTFVTATGSSIGTASTIPVTPTLTGDQFSSTGSPNSANSASLTQINNLVTNGTTTVSNVTLPLSSFQVTGNNISTTPTTPPTSQNQSTGTQPAITTSPGNINGGTTFDPDSFFQAQAPVITKVYNDNFLLRKMGTMSPLTEKAAFFAITLPAAMGLGIAIIGCMLCWQIECSYGRRKAKI